jgi:hypothetical protein
MLLRWFMASTVLIALAMRQANAQSDSGTGTGNEMLPACKAFVELKETPLASSFKVGVCAGEIDALLGVAGGLNELMRFCPPPGVTRGQAARVVVNWMERTPEALHLPLGVLAIDAFRASWPCK